MSIEDILKANTAAIIVATEAMTAANKINADILYRMGGQVAEQSAPEPVSPAPAKKTKAKAAASVPKDATPGMTYEKMSAALLRVNKEISRDALVTLLAKYGAKKGPDLKADDWAAIHGEALELLEAPKAVEADDEEGLI